MVATADQAIGGKTQMANSGTNTTLADLIRGECAARPRKYLETVRGKTAAS